jgi:hypothetical protein
MFPIKQAQIAIREGNKAKARKILVNLVKAEPHNPNAWLLLAKVLDDPHKAAYCREKAQTISEKQVQQDNTPSSTTLQRNNRRKETPKKCPSCAKLIPSDSRICPYCEYRLSRPESNSLQQDPSKPGTTKQHEDEENSYWIRIIISIFVAIGLAYGIPFFSDLLRNTSSPTVHYKVIGTSDSANILLINAQGGIEQSDHYLPFNRSFSFKNRTYASITATSYDSGTITCQIWVNDKLWRESKSSGLYSSVSCSGIIGDP